MKTGHQYNCQSGSSFSRSFTSTIPVANRRKGLMNTQNLEKMVRRICRNRFSGVFPSNHLPLWRSKCLLFIANTEDCTRKGEHWISIYIDEDANGEYFDSFGQPPNTIFKNYMDYNCKTWIYNGRKLQSVISDVCGHYCVFYCAYRCKGFSMQSIVSWFTTDTTLNDSLVYSFAS